MKRLITNCRIFDFHILILQYDNSGTKRRVSQRKNDAQKTANGTTQKTITNEIRTSYSERSELQSVLNIGTVGRLKFIFLFSFQFTITLILRYI